MVRGKAREETQDCAQYRLNNPGGMRLEEGFSMLGEWHSDEDVEDFFPEYLVDEKTGEIVSPSKYSM